MGKIVKHTDLSREEPGPRADLDLPQEDVEFRTKLPLVGGGIEMRARITPESSLSSAIITVVLVSTGCGCAGTMFAIGAPIWAAVSAMLLPAFVYFTLARRRAKPR